ncbi:MAG TPA: hypothetical protein PL017_08080 [Tenuifilaceae bacterium]|nr:hypothetical protein [Tenuifilaceae bacterium]HPE18588.1 hypothetical protein [Tenuifilaceae bacterium]HPJ46041.1 hypothetical protein [Tenuifilaceae bacterium]HPQ34744.1 hypothetical protein [Tenuifilaceae bacterium]HRX67373.1 hypothetical protein [Tenuifilaceae bacterium]
MKIKIKILLLSIAALPIFSGCRQGKNATTWEPPTNQFAFVEYYITYDGKPLEGTPPPGIRIDGPTYMYNSETGEINSYMESNFSSDTITTVIGIGKIRRGTEGGGLSSRLVGVKDLPYSNINLSIDSFTSEMMLFRFKGEKLSLKAGEEWQRVYESIDTIPSMQGNAIVQRKVIHQVNFRGFFMKDSLKLYGN